MNEKIKDLLTVCGMPNEDLFEIFEDPSKSFYLEQFAKLIIQECIVVGNRAFHNDNSVVPVFPTKQIKDHFEGK